MPDVKWNEDNVLTVGWCVPREGQEDDTFPPQLQVRCLHIFFVFWRCLHIGEVLLADKLLLTELLQHLVNKEQLLVLEPFNLSYH